MALLRDIGHNLENFKILNKSHQHLNYKTRMGFRIEGIIIPIPVVKDERSEVVLKSVPIERNVG